jgi:peptidyl-prolyl cis-trans isomerase A (cyclophilin A)
MSKAEGVANAASRGRRLLLGGLAGGLASLVADLHAAPGRLSAAPAVSVRLETELGAIVIDLATQAAPVTCANFLRHLDQGLWKGASFYRTVSPANDHNPATINVIQGGLNLDDGPLPPIAHETTRASGVRHSEGTISMARGAPGTASCDFFICLGDNPELDFGGARNPDGQGFAAFGRVAEGMEVVRRIHQRPANGATEEAYLKGQILDAPVRILSVSRVTGA